MIAAFAVAEDVFSVLCYLILILDHAIRKLLKQYQVVNLKIVRLKFIFTIVFREYDLVPIAAEDYGDMTHSYKVVAAARKADLYMTLFNLKRMYISLRGNKQNICEP